jgi:hypothetical protein
MKKLSDIDKKDKKKKKTYPQNWSAYNKAQMKEKLLFLDLMRDLVFLIPRRSQRTWKTASGYR